MTEIRSFTTEKFRYIGVFEGENMISGYYERVGEGIPVEGDVYIGRIISFDKSRKNAFVDINCSKNAILPLRRDNKISAGDMVACEVIRGEKGYKGAKLSLSYTVAGENIILKNGRKKISFSKKLTKEDLRPDVWSGLKELSREFDGEILIRSGILQVEDSEKVKEEVEGLKEQLLKIEQKSRYSTKIGKVHSSGGLLERVKRGAGREVSIVNDDVFQESECFKIGDFICSMSSLYNRIIDLPKGGSMVIDRTEAMYTVDINSGGSNSRDINRENAEFICREILKRNLNGIIVIDFINFENKKAIQELAEYIKTIINEDTVKGKVYFNEDLGLVEIARNRRGMSLYEVLEEVKESRFQREVFMDKKESQRIITKMVDTISCGIRSQKNKFKMRFILKLNPYFYGMIEEHVQEIRAELFENNVVISMSYDEEYNISYSYF